MKKYINILVYTICILLLIIMSRTNLNAVPCPNLQGYTCVEEEFIWPCSTEQGSPYCTIWVTFCYKPIVGGGISLFITDYSYDENCPCTNKITSAILAHIFNKEEIKTALGVNQPGSYTATEMFTANCVKLEIDPEHIGVNNGTVYKVINCENSSCCEHNYSVTYEYSCPNGICGFHPTNITTIGYNIPENDCILPCFPNCQNWSVTVVIPPGMQKIGIIEDDIQINENDINLDSKFLNKNIEQFSIVDLNGTVLFKSSKFLESEYKIFVNQKLSSGTYFYLYKLNNQFHYGKIQILK